MTEVKVNLWGQKKSRYYRLYLVLTGASLIYILTCQIIPTIDFKLYLVLWIFFLPGFLATVFYFLAKLPILHQSLPYLKLTSRALEMKTSLFNKSTKILWTDVQDLTIHLFQVCLDTRERGNMQIDLSLLTDENRTRVKHFLNEKTRKTPVTA